MSVDLPNSRETSCENDRDEIQKRLPEKNCLIRGKNFSFAIGRQLSLGRFGAVYEVLRHSDGKRFAAKLELCDGHFHGLNIDYTVLEQTTKKKLKYFPELIDFGKIQGYFKFIIMSMLDKNLNQLRFLFVENRFSLSTSLRLGIQTLNALKELHSLGYVHRDIKATNFVVNREPYPNLKVYIIDFGLCRTYRGADGEIKPPRDKTCFRGTTRYASLSAHYEKEQSPRDDLESWYYMLIEMTSGDLPWSKMHRDDREEVKKIKLECRTHNGMQLLLKECPSVELSRILSYIDNLTYYSQPDYDFIIQLLNLTARNYAVNFQEPYDWEE